MFNLRLVLLAMAFLGSAYGQAVQSSADAASKTGTVQGSVMDGTLDQPIRKALVMLRKAEEPAIGTYTDVAGKFTFHDIDPGTYMIAAEHDGFVKDPKAETITVSVDAGAVSNAGTFKLKKTGAVSGHISANGDPVMSANVQLQPWKVGKNRPGIVWSATTDDRGNYRAYNITPGKYKLAASYPQNAGRWQVKMQVDRDKPAGASAEAYGTTYFGGTPDDAQAAVIQIDPGAELQGVDVVLLRAKAFRITGRVTGPDGSQPGSLVIVNLTSVGGIGSFDSRVGSDGNFELLQVPPGKYTLSAIAMFEPGKQATAHQLLEIGEADVNDVQLTFVRQQSVTGKVIAPPNRKLTQGLMLLLQPREQMDGRPMIGGEGGFAQLQEGGSFSMEGVNPGDYDVVLATAGKGDDLYVESIRSGDQDVLSTGLHIGANTSGPIEVTLQANGAEIDCTVLDAKQKPIVEAQVTLLPDPPRRSEAALWGECRTDASGKCVLLGIAPGDYHAFAFAKGDSVNFSDAEVMSGFEKQGTAIAVVQGDKKPLQLSLLQLEQ